MPGTLPLRPLFEQIEPKILMDSQIGTVTMPYNGFLSAAVYDSTGEFIATLNDSSGTLLQAVPESAGNVAIWWDGKDELGRTVMQDGTYTWKALTSQAHATSQGGVGDSEFSSTVYWGGGDWMDANEQVTAVVASGPGMMSTDMGAGGTFVRAKYDSYYGDTSITTQNLGGIITASGKFDIATITKDMLNGAAGWGGDGDSGFFIGHFSKAANKQEFIGLFFQEGDGGLSSMRLSARFQIPGGSGCDSTMISVAPNTQHTFSYTYDPSKGAYGRLTVTIDSVGVLSVDLSNGQRYSGASFDGFGMGITTNFSSENAPAKTVVAYLDDAAYSGRTGTQNFTTSPANWTGVGNTANGNNYGWGTYDSHYGRLFEVSRAEEGGSVRQLNANGLPGWEGGGGGNTGVATDGTYLYTSVRIGDEDRITKYFPGGGSMVVGFSQTSGGYIVVNNDPYDPRPAGQNLLTPEQRRLQYSLFGMATDGTRLFVSNYRNNKVEVFDCNTGLELGEFALNAPLGIAMDGNSIWVANNHDRVSRYTWNGSYVFTEDTARRINLGAGADPSGVAILASNHHLFVSETGHMHIHEYDLGGTGAPVLAGLKTFGSDQGYGDVGDSTFHFTAWASITVSTDGILSVVDSSGSRIQQFYTQSNPAAGITAGDLYHSIYGGSMGPAPIDAYNYNSDGTYYLVSKEYTYLVDPNYSGGPRAGWMGDGSWKLVKRYCYDNGPDVGWHRVLMDGQTPREFMYTTDGRNVVIWALGPNNTMRMSAVIGGTWLGDDYLDDPIPFMGGQFNWTDTDGDGKIDWNGTGSGANDGEVNWFVPIYRPSVVGQSMIPWIDDAGNMWTSCAGSVVKVPLEGFDAVGNPIYNWAHQVTVIQAVDDDIDFIAGQVRAGADGSVVVFGTALGRQAVAYFDPSGVRKSLTFSPYDVIRAISSVDGDPTPDYYFTAHSDVGYRVYMWTNDGLMVTCAYQGYSGGWIDYPYGVGAIENPITGEIFIYGEEVYYGKADRYRIDGLSTIVRSQGTFAYVANDSPDGKWTFDNTLNDSIGTNNAAYVGGTPSYTAGRLGNGLNMQAANADYVDLPHAKNSDEYTVSLWVKPVDTTSVNIITRTNASGPTSAFSSQIRLDASGRFQAYAISGFGTVSITGTTMAQANTWYHVAITALPGDKLRLYVNGQEEGTPVDIGAAWTGGDRYQVGNATPGGFGYFDGVIDDVRVYDKALLASDIMALSGPTTTVEATDNAAAEAGSDTGTFTIRRNTSSGALTVFYTMSGTATSGSDYASPSGSVVIADGQTSAIVTIYPINDSALDPSETVQLNITTNANYVSTVPAAYLVITDDDAVGDPGWYGSNNTVNGNSFGWSYNTNYANGQLGEIGGTFSRYQQDAFYADVNLTTTLTPRDRITASGKLDMTTITSGWGGSGDSGIFIGHFSELADSKEFVGIMLEEADSTGAMRVRARLQNQTGSGSDSAIYYLSANGNYTFSYTLDPTIGNGRLTVNISGLPTMVVDLSNGDKNGPMAFDAFGIGYTSNMNGPTSQSGYTAQVYIDDLNYTGSLANQPVINVSATDADAAEAGLNPGTFTITRSNSSGSLTVNYTLGGTATSGTDFSALSGSVVFVDGQSSAIVTVTPVDDHLVETSESVILTISGNDNYRIGTSGNATLSIADNDLTPAVLGRHLFYNHTSLDGGGIGAGPADDNAIASDKSPLIDGQTPTAANLSSFSGGINGIMIDVTPLSGSVAASDFTFRVMGADGSWTTAPSPASVTVRAGAGTAGGDRITIIWADNAISNKWLEVTVKQGGTIGLSQADTFCFGNLGADANGDARVDFSDYLSLEASFGGSGPTGADFDASGRVDFTDYLILESAFGAVLPPPGRTGNLAGLSPLFQVAAEEPAAAFMTAETDDMVQQPVATEPMAMVSIPSQPLDTTPISTLTVMPSAAFRTALPWVPQTKSTERHHASIDWGRSPAAIGSDLDKWLTLWNSHSLV